MSTSRNFPLLSKLRFRKKIFFKEAIEKGNFRILKTGFHKFEPQGLTDRIFSPSESHLSFTPGQRENHMAIDLFTCSDTKPTKKSLNHIICGLKKTRQLK